MIDPPLPASIIGGTTALMVCHTPVRLVSRVSCHCCAEISHSRPQFSTPALATTMSRRPNCSTASATTRCWPSRSRTSTSLARILRPSPSTRRTVSARSSGVDGCIAVAVGDGPAGVDRDDVGARPGQPHAMRTALSACGSRDVGDRPASGLSVCSVASCRGCSSMGDVPGVMDDVVQVIERDRGDGEFASVAAKSAPRPGVGGHPGVGVGDRVGGVHAVRRRPSSGPARRSRRPAPSRPDPSWGTADRPRRASVDALVEDAVHVADVAAVLEHRPHPGRRARRDVRRARSRVDPVRRHRGGCGRRRPSGASRARRNRSRDRAGSSTQVQSLVSGVDGVIGRHRRAPAVITRAGPAPRRCRTCSGRRSGSPR